MIDAHYTIRTKIRKVEKRLSRHLELFLLFREKHDETRERIFRTRTHGDLKRIQQMCELLRAEPIPEHVQVCVDRHAKRGLPLPADFRHEIPSVYAETIEARLISVQNILGLYHPNV